MFEGVSREVWVEGHDEPVVRKTYTIPEAARALGKAELTFKGWIRSGMIPEPVLVDTVRNYRHYSAGELLVIARVLADHEKEFSYYTAKHTATRNRLTQQITGYRSRSI